MEGMQHAASAWKEMDDFHMVMMATWHPVKQSNDLGPIRAKAAALSDKAQAWAKSKVPSACDTKETRDAIAKVAEESRALADLVARNASDDQVRAALAGVHDRFEPVEHGCKPGHHG
jgi:hypothetical protein